MSDGVVVGLAAGGLSLGAVGLVVAVAALRRAAALGAAYRRVVHGSSDDLFSALDRQVQDLERVAGRTEQVAGDVDRLRSAVGRTLSRVVTVRYDAFDGMGGQTSFSSALLDDGGNGVVITCLNGRTDSRTYAKSVDGGASSQPLSDEEAEAVRRAMEGEGAVASSAPVARPGRRARAGWRA